MDSELKKFIWVLISLGTFVVINLIPIEGLEPLGRLYLGVIVSMLILWITEAVPAPVTFFIQIALVTLMIPLISTISSPAAFGIAMSGMATNTLALFICAFFIVGAAEKSGLARRLALLILKMVGPKRKMLVIGLLFAGVFLNLFIPAAMSVSALLTGIVAGIVLDYKLDKNSNFSKSLYLAIGVGTIAGNVFIQTAGAPAIAVTGLISQFFGHEITYFEYMRYGFPLAFLMSFFAYQLITRRFPSEMDVLPGGDEYIRNKMKELGKLSIEEKKVAVVLSLTVLMWMTGELHPLSTQTVGFFAVFILMCPRVGVYKFPELANSVPWGMIIFMGSSMSLAAGMVAYGTAGWLVNQMVEFTNLTAAPFLLILVGTMLICSISSVVFTVRAACVNAIIPIVAALAFIIAESMGADFRPMGFTFVMFYPLLFAIFLPVHSPFTLFPNAAGGFSSADLLKVTPTYIALSVVSCILLYFTYWRWIGLT